MFSEKIIEHYFLFYSTRDEVTGERRKLHNEELCDLYYLPNIIRVTKSRRMRWAGYVAHTGDRSAYRVLMEGGDHLEDLGLDGLIIIR